ncbi:hypothetical protein C1H46_032369 [Malus baccata]|uniref:Uncharacterized protein n=1 Tax=Malus baccata TaxID=106549 RepID=A0A540L6H5_MALBA|nr:hypothetical protein C1H46_032369 [Malus baccata]
MHFPLMRSANLTRRTSNHLHLTDIQKQEALPQLSKPTTSAPTPPSSLESTRSMFGTSAPSSPTAVTCMSPGNAFPENASASHLLVGSLEDPQVAISDASSTRLQITANISSEGNVKKRKDLDTPLEPQLAKRHTGHDGTDV